MKNMNMVTHGTPAALPLLVHTKLGSFGWGKASLNSFCSYAKKQNLTIQIMYHWQEVLQWRPDSPLIIFGIDQEWLDEALQNLAPLHLKIILISGVAGKQYHNITHLLFDQHLVIQSCLELLQNNSRTRTALFGIQEKDTSDATKADIFGRLVSPSDVYWFSDDINTCFDQFYANLERYDSVICSNDVVAVYLLGRCQEYGIAIPSQLHLIGNCNIWLSSRVTPALTTISYNQETLVDVTIQLWRNLLSMPYVHSLDVRLIGDILERTSTGITALTSDRENQRQKAYEYDEHFFHNATHVLCPEVLQIQNLDRVLSACSLIELTILQRLAEGSSYEAIAKESFLSVDTVKYYVKKLYRLLHIHKRQELEALLAKYGLKLI